VYEEKETKGGTMREKIMADFRKEIGILQSNMVFKDEYEEQKVEI
jgi:hypothetical protein